MHHSRVAGRREQERHRHALAEQLYRGVHVADVAQVLRHELPAPERGQVPLDRELLVRPARDVIEDPARHPATRGGLEIGDVVAAGEPFAWRARAAGAARRPSL